MSDAAEYSERQRELLGIARVGDPDDVARALWTLLREPSSEPLHPEWLALWEQAKPAIRREFPAQMAKTIEEALAKVERIDSALEQFRLLPEDHACLLLGAGASAPEPSSIPTVAALLPELWRRARRLGREEIDRLIDWSERHSVTNIEDLLTAAYIANFAAKNTAVTGLLNYFLFKREADEQDELYRFRPGRRIRPQVDTASIALLQDTLQVLFGLLTGRMIPAAPNAAHDAVVAFVKGHPNATIVTTNYDGCMDEALLRAGVLADMQLDESRSDPTTLDLIKMHGSINWSYCDSCHDARAFDLLKLKDTYEHDSLSYAVIGICRNCQGQRRPLLIPPMGLKFVMFPNLIRLWNNAREAVEKARMLVVVGYSFSEADSYVNKIIERSMTVNPGQHMLVCDSNPSLVSVLRARFAARIDGFDKGRVLRALGSAEEIVPQVLSRLLSGVTATPPGPNDAARAAIELRVEASPS